jgi:hypothetical protein
LDSSVKMASLALAGVLSGFTLGMASGLGLASHASHSAPQAKVEDHAPCKVPKGADVGNIICFDGEVLYTKPVIVYRRAPDVNALLILGHRLCLGDGGLGTVLLFPAVKENAEFLCAFGHRAYTEAGMRL